MGGPGYTALGTLPTSVSTPDATHATLFPDNKLLWTDKISDGAGGFISRKFGGWIADVFANRPAASGANESQLFYATDTVALYISTGAAWKLIDIGAIAPGSVTNAMLADMATKTYKGRTSGGTGVPEDVPVATLKTDLVLVKGDVGLGSVDNTADAAKNVLSATKLTTARLIGGVSFDGTSDITVASATGAFAVTGLLSANGGITIPTTKVITITDSPSAATDGVNKAYVDSAIQGLDIKADSDLGTIAALPSNVYANGSSGVGATLTGVAFGALSVDGTVVTVGMRILVKNEAAPANNGIYTVTVVGAVATLYVLTRATDADQSAEVSDGMFTFVKGGSTLASTGWTMTTSGTITIGTTAQAFAQFSGAGTYTAGSGLTLTGTVFSLNASPTFTAPLLGTPASGVLTNCTFPTLNQNTTGSAAQLTTARTIGGVSFNGTANITVASATGGFTITGAALVAPACTTGYPSINIPSGTLETTPAAGDFEYDGAAFYATADTTQSRTLLSGSSIFRLSANGSAIGPTIADFFGANSAFPTVLNGVYEIIFYCFYLKTTTGTVTFTVTNTQTYTNFSGTATNTPSNVTTTNTQQLDTTTAAAAAFGAQQSMADTLHGFARVACMAECGTAGNIRLRITSSAGTVTPQRGSYYTVRRLPAANVGSFVA